MCGNLEISLFQNFFFYLQAWHLATLLRFQTQAIWLVEFRVLCSAQPIKQIDTGYERFETYFIISRSGQYGRNHAYSRSYSNFPTISRGQRTVSFPTEHWFGHWQALRNTTNLHHASSTRECHAIELLMNCNNLYYSVKVEAFINMFESLSEE